MNFLLVSIFLFLLPSRVYAVNQYTAEDVSSHSRPSDCWMIYDGGVYDITSYVSTHDKYMDIREWCGIDMTEDFETKAGAGDDHKASTYSMLNAYYIGDILAESVIPVPPAVDVVIPTENDDDEEDDQVVIAPPVNDTKERVSTNPYNLLVPLVLTVLIYWVSYFVFKRKLKKFNAFWNTVLLLTLVIPSFGFGVFMMLRYSFPNLYNMKFDFMYWHVELSVVMGTLAISHLIQRLRLYIVQLKK